MREIFAVVASVVLAFAAGCGDQIVGQFGSSEGGTNQQDLATTTGSVDDDSQGGGGATTASLDEEGSADSTGAGAAVGPCTPMFTDAFDSGAVDPAVWNTWEKFDATVAVQDGRLKFIPATARQPDGDVSDAGIVGSSAQFGPFEDRALRLHVEQPPGADQNVLMFLMLNRPGDEASMSIQLVPSLELNGTSEVPGDSYSASFEDIVPEWIGMAVVDGQVHYQISDDGESWTTVYVGAVTADLMDLRPLVMTQTYGDSPSPTFVFVDDLTICDF